MGYENQRHYAATPDELWAGLQQVVSRKYKVKSADPLSRSMTFSTGMTAFTSGSTLEASIIPSGDGGLLRLSATARMRTQVGNASAQRRAAVWVFDNVSQAVMHNRGTR